MGGDFSMPFREIRKREAYLRIVRCDKEGYMIVPILFRKYFGKRIKLLFDPEKNLIPLKPSNSELDYPTSRWRIWCTAFLKEYNIPAQNAEAHWDSVNKYLVAKIEREI